MSCYKHSNALERCFDPVFDFYHTVFQHADCIGFYTAYIIAESHGHACRSLRRQCFLIAETVPLICDGHRLIRHRIFRQVIAPVFIRFKIVTIDAGQIIPLMNLALTHGIPFNQFRDLNTVIIVCAGKSKDIPLISSRCKRQIDLLPVSFYRHLYQFSRLHTGKIGINSHISGYINVFALKLSNDIAFHQSRFGCRTAFFHHHHFCRIITHEADDDHSPHKGQNKVKNGTGCNDCNPLAGSFCIKSPFLIFASVLTQHHAGTAEGQKFPRIAGSPFFKTQNSRSHTERKFRNHNSIHLRQQKMSQFMEQYNGTEDENRNNYTHTTTLHLFFHKSSVPSPKSPPAADLQSPHGHP